MTDEDQAESDEPDGAEGPDDEEMVGDPIPDVFDPDDAAARFVVAMSMANNDIDRALRDLVRAAEVDAPDFGYRVRLVTGHLVEAIDSLNAYTQTYPDKVGELLKRVPQDGQKELKPVRGTLQKAGPDALEAVRHSTFHYPSPKTSYSPSSDEQLRDVLAGMSGRGVQTHLDGDTRAVTLTFADDAALDLAMGKPTATNEEIAARAQVARDGALAFINWATALMRAYMKSTGASWGEPIVSDKPKPHDPADREHTD